MIHRGDAETQRRQVKVKTGARRGGRGRGGVRFPSLGVPQGSVKTHFRLGTAKRRIFSRPDDSSDRRGTFRPRPQTLVTPRPLPPQRSPVLPCLVLFSASQRLCGEFPARGDDSSDRRGTFRPRPQSPVPPRPLPPQRSPVLRCVVVFSASPRLCGEFPARGRATIAR